MQIAYTRALILNLHDQHYSKYMNFKTFGFFLKSLRFLFTPVPVHSKMLISLFPGCVTHGVIVVVVHISIYQWLWRKKVKQNLRTKLLVFQQPVLVSQQSQIGKKRKFFRSTVKKISFLSLLNCLPHPCMVGHPEFRTSLTLI